MNAAERTVPIVLTIEEYEELLHAVLRVDPSAKVVFDGIDRIRVECPSQHADTCEQIFRFWLTAVQARILEE